MPTRPVRETSLLGDSSRIAGLLRQAVPCCLFVFLGFAAPCAATTTVPLSADRQARLARIDSLWQARQGAAAQAGVEQQLAVTRRSMHAAPPARTAAGSRSDSAYVMHLRLRQGHMRVALGQSLAAEPPLRQAVALTVALRDSVYECAALRWLGVTVASRGSIAEARTIYEHLIEIATAIGRDTSLGWGRLGLAYCDRQAGDLDAARRGYLRAADLLRAERLPRGELMALNGLGNVLTDLGDYAAARQCYRRSAGVGREIGFLYVEAMAENNLGTLEFSLGDPGLAMQHFSRAVDLHLEDGSLRESVVPALNTVDCLTRLGRHREALVALDSLIVVCRDGDYRELEATVLKRMGYVRAAQGRPHRAAAIFREMLSDRHAELSPLDTMEALLGLSAALANHDSTQAALDALRARRAWVAGLDQPALKTRFRLEEGARRLENGDPAGALEELLEAAAGADALGLSGFGLRSLAAAGRAATLLGRRDQALAILTRAAHSWERERRVPLDPEWREQRGAAARLIYTQLGGLLLDGPPAMPTGQRCERAFDALQVFKSRTLLERMRGPGRGDDDAAFERGSITLARLQSEILTEGELLLDFYLGPDQSLLFAVTSEQRRAVRLPGAAQLEPALRLFHQLLASPPQQHQHPGGGRDDDGDVLEQTTEQVRRLLFADIADLMQGRSRLIYAPDGALNLLPLAPLLRRGATASGAAGEAPPFTCEVQRTPSATLLAWIRTRQPSPRAARPGGSTLLAIQGRAGAGGRALTGARREVEHLARRFANVRRRAALPEPGAAERLAAELGAFDVLHFAAHSTVDDQSPWRSAIRLDPAGGGAAPAEGMRLEARQVAAMRLETRLAVLASCATAGGRVLSGEGVQGLTSAFLSAGVQAIVATLWPVDDRSTARLMELFYDGLERGETAGAALGGAQRSLAAAPATAPPFFWAGFVLSGEGGVRVELHRRRAPLPGWLLVAPAIAAAGALWVLWWRRSSPPTAPRRLA